MLFPRISLIGLVVMVTMVVYIKKKVGYNYAGFTQLFMKIQLLPFFVTA